MDWNIFYVGMAAWVSEKSKDRSTKVGAVAVHPDSFAVLAIGYNGFPRGIDDECQEYHNRPTKYLVTEHAERNLIYNCARHGIALDGAILYMHYEPVPCCDCARGVIQAGIKTIVGPEVRFPGKGQQWEENLSFARRLLDEAEITLINIPKCDLVHEFGGSLV